MREKTGNKSHDTATRQLVKPEKGIVFVSHQVDAKKRLVDLDEAHWSFWEEKKFDPKNHKPDQFTKQKVIAIRGMEGHYQVWIAQLDPVFTTDSLGRAYIAQRCDK